jgi:hypothetical protein
LKWMENEGLLIVQLVVVNSMSYRGKVVSGCQQ